MDAADFWIECRDVCGLSGDGIGGDTECAANLFSQTAGDARRELSTGGTGTWKIRRGNDLFSVAVVQKGDADEKRGISGIYQSKQINWLS